jgi:peptidoglycan/xylan/chitin deacetylase (PgdA/CDA1 family)
MSALPQGEQAVEIAAGATTIGKLTGVRPTYFRPPHGAYDAATIVAARAQGDTVALWDVDPGDWRSLTADRIVDNVLTHGRSPAVLLLHNGKFATLEALPRIVRAYRAAGFDFVTLSQLQARLSLPEINDPVRIKLQ